MRVNGNLVIVGQVKDLKIDNLAADPASPVESQMWYNTTEKALKYNDGVVSHVISTGSGDLSNYLKHDGTVAMTGVLSLVSDDQSAAPAVAAISKGHLDAALALKQNNLTGATSGLTTTNLSSSMAAVSNASGKLVSATSATAAEVEFLAGVTSGIQAQIDSKEPLIGYVPVNKAGDAMSGNLAMGGNRVTGLAAAVDATDAVRLADMEAALAGLDFQPDVLGYQEDATLDPSASPTVGARYIISAASNLHANFGTIAGVQNNDIVEYDGTDFQVIYDVSTAGPGAICWDRGTSTWKYYNGTDWSQFGGLDSLNAGIGLVKSGNTIDISMGAGIAQLPSDEVGVDVLSTGGLFTTIDGSTSSTDTAAKLAVKIDVAGGLATTASGIKVDTSGIVEGMLNTSIVGFGLQGAGGTALSVKTDAGSGITVDANGVSVDDVEMRTRVLYRDGAEAMTGALILSSSDQTGASATTAISKGHLDAAITVINTAITDLTTRMGNGYFLYEQTVTPSVSHTVTHNMGTRYVGVTVIDSSGEVVIPQSISYTDVNSLTVTFSSAETCRVVVNGLKAA